MTVLDTSRLISTRRPIWLLSTYIVKYHENVRKISRKVSVIKYQISNIKYPIIKYTTWEDPINRFDFGLCYLIFKVTKGQNIPTNQNHSCLHNTAQPSDQNIMKHYGIMHWMSDEMFRSIH